MGNLDGLFARGQQPRAGEDGNDARGVRAAIDVELGQRDAPAHHLRTAVGGREPEQDRSRDHLLVRAQAAVRSLGEAGDRAANALALPIRLDRQRATRPPLPELEQRR